MAYSQQSFQINHVLTNTNLNNIENNIVSTREISGCYSQIASGYSISSGWQTPDFTDIRYIDTSGKTYITDLGGGEYGWRASLNDGQLLVAFSCRIGINANVNSSYIQIKLLDVNSKELLNSNRVDVSSASNPHNPFPIINLSGSMLPTGVGDGGVTTGYLSLYFFASNSSIFIPPPPHTWRWASCRYLTRNY